jgi:hypothetical protein
MLHTKVNNLAGLWKTLCEELRDYPYLVPKAGGGYNFRGDYYIHIYDLFWEVESCFVPGLCLEDVGYSSTNSKINHLISRYLDHDATVKWLNYIVERMKVTPDVYGELPFRTKEHWTKREMAGGCISDLMFRGAPEPTLVVVTRAMEMPTKGMGDMMFVSAMAKVICRMLAIPDMKIKWYMASAWTRSRTANYYAIYKWPQPVVWSNKDFQEHFKKGWEKYYLSDYEFSYNANKRAKKLFLDKKAGTLQRKINSNRFLSVLEDFLQC